MREIEREGKRGGWGEEERENVQERERKGERERMYKKEKEREREREIRKQSFHVSQAAHIFAIFKSQCPEIFARSRV